ncbi:MAG: c-type cytochrome [Bacteroidales bacterium]
MKILKYYQPLIFLAFTIAFIGGCKKDNTNTTTVSLYTPTTANVTANASLTELQQGRTLYINNCNRCHSLYAPETYTPSQWKTILVTMAPRTSMSASDVQLVTKYLCKGNQ